MIQGVFLTLFTVFFWLLEGTLFSQWTFWGIKADLILVFLIITLLFYGKGYGILVALVGGILMDTYLMTQGFHILFYLSVVFLLSPFLSKIDEDGMIIALTVILITGLENFFFYLYLLAWGAHPPFYRLLQIVPAQILLNLTLMFFCYFIFRQLRILTPLLRAVHGDTKTTTY